MAKKRAASTASKRQKKMPQVRTAPAAPRAPDHDVMNRIRGVNLAFCRAVPHQALSTGAFDVRDARARSGGVLQIGPALDGVDDGFYRVEGSDWILTVGGGELLEVQKARPDLDYHNLVKVPSQ